MLGFDQHPDSYSAGKSRDTAHLESQLGKGPGSASALGETSNIAVWGSRF